MRKLVRHLSLTATVTLSLLAPPAQAAALAIDFESLALRNVYFAEESFVESGFKMTLDFDAGTVDSAVALGVSAPTGNATQFFSGLNDSGLILEREGGGLFSLAGFDVAFIPLAPPSSQNTVIVAAGVRADNSSFGLAWVFGQAFQTLNDPGDFSAFTDVKAVEFFACSFNGVNVCAAPTANNGQFAIDNIQVTFVPEPSTLSLLPLALLGLVMRKRRAVR